MAKERPVSLDDGDMHEILFQMDPTNEDSTHVKQRIRILEHPQNLLEVLYTRLTISQGLTGIDITSGPNQYRFTQTFLNGEALRVFSLKAVGLWHKTVANLVLVMNHVVTYFGPI